MEGYGLSEEISLSSLSLARSFVTDGDYEISIYGHDLWIMSVNLKWSANI